MIIISYYAEGYFSPPNKDNVDYGPGDTQSLFFSSIFCEELSASKDTLYSNSFLQSTLYLLSEPSTLTREVDVSFNDVFSIFDKVHQRDFHLFPGSVIAIEACADKSTYDGVGSFYLVKGKSTYEEWSDAGGKNDPKSVASLHIWNFCDEEPTKSISFTVIEEDQYYLMFINDRHMTPYISEIYTNYTIQRRVYDFNESSVINSCSFTTNPCALKMPFQHTTSVLLTYGKPLDWGDEWNNKAIDIMCIPRVWFYIILTATGILLLAASTFFGCVVCCCISRFLLKEDEAEAPLLNSRTGTLYDNSPPMKEMDDPSKYEQGRSGNQYSKTNDRYRTSLVGAKRPNIVAHRTHPPPSFKKSPGPRFAMGSPTYETFTRK